MRLRLAGIPLERDEGEYAYAGQLILQGFPPYLHAYNMKFPGVYYAYAAIMGLFGRTPWGIHAGLLFVNAACILLVYAIGRRLSGSFLAATAAVIFALLSMSQSILGVFAHATHFAILAALAGFFVLLSRDAARRIGPLLTSGACLGIAVLMKQHALFLLLWGACWLGWARWTEGEDREEGAMRPEARPPGDPAAKRRVVEKAEKAEKAERIQGEVDGGEPHSGLPARAASSARIRRAAFSIALLFAGSALPLIVISAVFAWQGVLGRFWFWTFGYAREYVTQVPLSSAAALLIRGAADLTRTNLLLWLLAIPGLIVLWAARRASAERVFVTGLLASSFLSVCPGFYFRQHYFVLMLPAIALLVGTGFDALRQFLDGRGWGEASWLVPGGLFLLAVVFSLAPQREFLFTMEPTKASRATYGANPFPESVEIARYIKEHTEKEDRIAVLGSEPQIYFYADRLSATGYIYTYPLMEKQRYARGMQEEMIREIEAAHPAYMIFVEIPTSWLVRPDSDKTVLDWSERYAAKCYDIAGIADIHSMDDTTYVWGDQVAKYKPLSENLILVFKRKQASGPCVAGI